MSNLSIENLSRSVQMGGADDFMGMGGVAPEARVLREMQSQGLRAGPDDSVSAAGAAGPKTFADVLQHSVEKVNTYQQQSDVAMKELVAGRTKNIHETMLTIERADTSLKLMMQVRNKILDAYREIMRMQV
ncbi:MAG TPA: flagellar hook-basal body complex protein FliE [Bdellovibrionales bacterium]|nr:flagellar hook-basal body complex protein FliE [Bdellovibrionales bacterium]HCM39604.1 flagellar hook-basal body complex protein FliE [Bdellovibrionales bacterium]